MDVVAVSGALETDATEAVDDLRNPLKEIESRLLFRGRILDVEVDEALPDAWRGTRDIELVAIDGEALILLVPVTVFALGVSELSMKPNSLRVGEGFVEEEVGCALLLCLRFISGAGFWVGDPAADVLLEIRGILVGVSFGMPDEELSRLFGGPSLGSLVIEVLAPPTDGDPAIVGSWLRPRREVSDCFCMELTVCDVSLDDDAEEPLEEVDVGVPPFSRATR